MTILSTAALGVFAVAPATAQPFGYQQLNPVQQRHVSGLLSTVLNGEDPANAARALAPNRATPSAASPCANRYGANVKVNQNCLNLTDPDLQGRAQAQNETWAAADPNNPDHVIATYNDYRRGDGTCGVSYSLDGTRTWADATTPNGFSRGNDFGGAPREYWQSGGDTSVAWDSRGNAYLSCQVFNRGSAVSPNPDQSSAFLVFRSTGTNGASWNFTGRPVATHDDTAGAGNFLLDKQLLTVDNNPRSPFRDRVYVSWTTFADDGTGYIYEAYSADYGETFSAPVLVSADTPLCANALGFPTPRGRCNQNQDSQPFVGPDGALYVVFNNFNNATANATDNHNQVLLARSSDGGQSFSAPVLVGNYHELPDCATYQNGQDPGRACVPEKGPSANSVFRASNYPIGGVDPKRPNRILVTYGSYINRNSNENTGCTPTGFNPATGINTYTGVKNGTCNNDIVLSSSANAGASFTGGTADVRQLPVVTTAGGQARTDQFWQGAAFSPDGTFAVSYYDRQYGADETTGFSDITVSTAAGPGFTHTRATSGSMPPPTQFAGTFYGDYAGIAVTARAAYPVWSDTRPPDLFLCPGTGTPGTPPGTCQAGAPNASIANDQDTYATSVGIR
ncbi:sialidase family protein [Amycolatopsis sp. RTGN1]|uniref:sialidase family protein n=1 Tax=Amycolatopsis ponsaeliensis TaxID=2992142 RepID=UPI00254C70F1|nr:sialidase family protein [Amycolatopsis sp. RTGN1]